MVRIRDKDGRWAGDFHRVDAEAWVQSGRAVYVGNDEAADPKPKRTRRPKAQPVEAAAKPADPAPEAPSDS